MNYNSLFVPGKPCFYLTTTSLLEFDKLARDLSNKNQQAVIRTIRGNKSKTVAGFFDEIAAAFQFPLYFGENWNAFYDCITDLDWIYGDAYILLVSTAGLVLSEADPQDFKVFIRIMATANEDWVHPNKYIPRNRQPTPFHVIFQCSPENISTFSSFLTQLGENHIVLQDIS